ncbi:MAG: hypothetical protein IJ313_03195 [Clostridia bacterium]|nr:hypothetical protein [Clostridia bacterium]
MTREELKNRLHEQTACVHASPALKQRALFAAQGKETTYMKKKLAMAVAIALIAVTLCAAALAAAGRWGMLDFADRYSVEHYIPEDAQDYVNTDVAVMENDWVTVNVRELYYDGRFSRMTVDVMPKGENVLLLGEDVCLEDLFINLTREYVMDGENDMRSVYQVIQDEGYEQVYIANVSLISMEGGKEGIYTGSMDYILGEDGTLTIFSQEEYIQDMPQREVMIRAIVMPFDQPLEIDSYVNYEKRSELEMPYTLIASVNPTNAPMKEGEIANVYVSEQSADYPSAGVRVDRVLIEVKPQEIYATVEYTVTDREKYAALDSWLWFEFIDPEKPGEGWEQRLAEGLSGGGTSGPIDREEENPTRFRQTETLGKNELHEIYSLRAYDASEKRRFETREFTMRPATMQDMEE